MEGERPLAQPEFHKAAGSGGARGSAGLLLSRAQMEMCPGHSWTLHWAQPDPALGTAGPCPWHSWNCAPCTAGTLPWHSRTLPWAQLDPTPGTAGNVPWVKLEMCPWHSWTLPWHSRTLPLAQPDPGRSAWTRWVPGTLPAMQALHRAQGAPTQLNQPPASPKRELLAFRNFTQRSCSALSSPFVLIIQLSG